MSISQCNRLYNNNKNANGCDVDQSKIRRFIEFYTGEAMTDDKFMQNVLGIVNNYDNMLRKMNISKRASDGKEKTNNELREEVAAFRDVSESRYQRMFPTQTTTTASEESKQCTYITTLLLLHRIGLSGWTVEQVLGFGSTGAAILLGQGSTKRVVKYMYDVPDDYQSPYEEANTQQLLSAWGLCPSVTDVCVVPSSSDRRSNNDDLVAIIMDQVAFGLYEHLQCIQDQNKTVITNDVIEDVLDLLLEFSNRHATHGDFSLQNIMVRKNRSIHDGDSVEIFELIAIDAGQSSTRISWPELDASQFLRSIVSYKEDSPEFVSFWFTRFQDRFNSLFLMTITPELYTEYHSEYTTYIGGNDSYVIDKIQKYNNNNNNT